MTYQTGGWGSTSCANQPTKAPVHRAASRKMQEKEVHQNKERCSKCGDSIHVEGFQCSAKKFQCKACHKFGHFTSLCYQKKQAPFKLRKLKAHQLQAGAVYAKESAICSQSEDYSSSKYSFCLQLISRRPKPAHLIKTWLID